MTEGICWLNLLLKHVCCVPALTWLQVGSSERQRTNMSCMLVRPSFQIHWATKLSCNLKKICDLANLTCVFGTSSYLQDQRLLDRGGVLFGFGTQLGTIPEDEPQNELVLEVDGEKGDNGEEMLGIFDDIDEKTRGNLGKTFRPVSIECTWDSRNQKNIKNDEF